MRRETSAGVLLFVDRPRRAFLVLLRDDGSPDLPKGHLKRAETPFAAARRELEEETGVDPDTVTFDRRFVFSATYDTKSKKSGEPVEKTVHVFAAHLGVAVEIIPYDHAGYAWIPWTTMDEIEREMKDNPTIVGAARAFFDFERGPHL